jgi:hypothetical protein
MSTIYGVKAFRRKSIAMGMLGSNMRGEPTTYSSRRTPQYFVIGYLYFWEIESDDKDLDNVSISAEIFLKDPADFSTVFYRLITIMTEAKQDFTAEMRSWRDNQE